MEQHQNQPQQHSKGEQKAKGGKILRTVLMVLSVILVCVMGYFGYKYYKGYQDNINKQKAQETEQKKAEEINNQEGVQNVDQPNGAASALPRSQDEQ